MNSAAKSSLLVRLGLLLSWHDFDGNVEMCRNGRWCDVDEDGSE